MTNPRTTYPDGRSAFSAWRFQQDGPVPWDWADMSPTEQAQWDARARDEEPMPPPRVTARDRLARYVDEYARFVWPGQPFTPPDDDALDVMEVRADSYANAHVEGEHEANGLCSSTSARECGERAAAAEYVECS